MDLWNITLPATPPQDPMPQFYYVFQASSIPLYKVKEAEDRPACTIKDF
jgi:hypothetical protein